MVDEWPFAKKPPHGSPGSTSIDLEDELRCINTSARHLTDYLKPQREAECSSKLTDRWIPGHANDNDKEQIYLLAQTLSPSHTVLISSAKLGRVILLRKLHLPKAENKISDLHVSRVRW
jgi:hypothetical protein